MAGKNGIPYRNAEGYPDPTAYEALSAAMAAATAEYNANQEPKLHPDEDDIRTQCLIKTLKNIIDLAGYDLLARIEVKDRRTGRVYR